MRGTWLGTAGRYAHASAWVVVAVFALGHTAVSWAYWAATGTGFGAARTATLTAPGKPTLVGSSTVTVSWTAATSLGNATITYYAERRLQAGSTWYAACSTSTSAPVTTTSCTDRPDGGGLTVYRVTAFLGSWTAASAESDAILVNDINPPAIAVTTANGTALNASSMTNQNVTAIGGTCGTATGDLTSITASITGTFSGSTTLTCTSGAWNWTLPSTWSAVGSSTITVSQKDAANNTGTASRTITIDKTAPTVATTTLDGAAQTWPVNRNTSVTTVGGTCGTATGDQAVTITVSGSRTVSGTAACSSGLWSYSVSPVLADGSYTLNAAQTDAAGNNGSATARTLSIDTVAPTIAVTLANGSALNASSMTDQNLTSIGGTCGTASGDLTSITAGISGVYNASTTLTCTSGAWTWTLGTAWSTAGASTITVSQKDSFNNTGTASRTITVDKTAPTVAITTLNGTTPPSWPANRNMSVTTVGGTCGTASGDQPVTVTISGSRSVSGSATCSSGVWSFTVSPALADGTYTLNATQTDAAGNSGSATARSLTIDMTGPAVSVTQVDGIAATSFPFTTSTSQINSFAGTCGIAPGDISAVTVTHSGPNSTTVVNSKSLTCSSSGTWSWNLGKGTDIKTAGTYTVTVTQSDTVGNQTVLVVQVIKV